MSTLSVLLPVFNAAPVMGQAVENILAQTMLPAEIVVADDGSEDDLGGRIARFRPECEARRVSLVHARFPANRGRGAARNLAVTACSGDLVAWFDVDDLWTPDKLAIQVTQFERLSDQHPAGKLLLTCNYVMHDVQMAAPRIVRPPATMTIDDIVAVHMRSHAQLQTVLGPREVFARFGFNDTLNRVEDFDFALRYAAAGGKLVNPDREGAALVHYFRSGANRSQEAVEANRRVVEDSAAVFRSRHVDPDLFLAEKLRVLRPEVVPDTTWPQPPAPGRVLPRRFREQASAPLCATRLEDGSLRIDLAHEAAGEFVAEDAGGREIARGDLRRMTVIEQAMLVAWFMDGASHLRLEARTREADGAESLDIMRTASGLITAA